MFVTGQSAVASNAKFADANIWMPTPTEVKEYLYTEILFANRFGNPIKNL